MARTSLTQYCTYQVDIEVEEEESRHGDNAGHYQPEEERAPSVTRFVFQLLLAFVHCARINYENIKKLQFLLRQ